MSSGPSGVPDRSGGRSTGCRTAARCRRGRASLTGRGRPPVGYFTRRAVEAWLRDILEQARRRTLPGIVRTGARFADAAAEFMRYAQRDQALKPSTLRGYRSIVSA